MSFLWKKSKSRVLVRYAYACKDAPSVERRADPRQTCNLPGWCAPAIGPGDSLRPTRVMNISAKGLALSTDRPFEAGTIISILPLSKNMTGNLLARVVRVMPDGTGQWIMGCRLVFPLSEEEVHTLLRAWQVTS